MRDGVAINEVIQPTQPARICFTKIAAVILALAALGLNGCVVGAGYETGYYAPSYAGYYGDYGYAGAPYWGYGPYVGSTIVIRGRSHRGYYGRHHFSHDWRGRSGRWHRSSVRARGQTNVRIHRR